MPSINHPFSPLPAARGKTFTMACVVGEEFLELRGKLGGQSLVVGDHQGRALDLLHNACHGEGLTAACDAHKGLVSQSIIYAAYGTLDGLRLVAHGLEFGNYFKFWQKVDSGSRVITLFYIEIQRCDRTVH